MGGFIVILIGITLFPTIAQQVSLATTCHNDTNISNVPKVEQADTGKTDSFGGGGTGHFGGYDGNVEHKDFLGKVGEYSIIKTNSSIFGNKDCSGLLAEEGVSSTLLGLVTLFFGLAIVATAIVVVSSGLRSEGLI